MGRRSPESRRTLLREGPRAARRRQPRPAPRGTARDLGRRGERGFGAVFLLVLVGIATLMLLGLSERGGLVLARTSGEIERERARALAHAGAEHALWRVQHEPCFVEENPGATFSRTMKTGSYSFQVSGTWERLVVDATGSAGKSRYPLRRTLERRPGAARTMLAWARKGNIEPQASEFVLGSWSQAIATDRTSDDAAWCVLRGSPVDRQRLFAAAGRDGALALQRWSRGNWRFVATLASDVPTSSRAFDIAYEQVSGEALVAYAKGASEDVFFRTWTGGTPDPEQILDMPLGKPLRWIALAARPGSDEIALLVIDDDRQLAAAMWTGAGFTAVKVLDTDLEAADFEAAAVTFLPLSGAALVVWTSRSFLPQRALHAVLWRDAWSPIASTIFPFEATQFCRLVAHPETNAAHFAALSKDRELVVVSGTGNAFVAPSLVTLDAATADFRCFDLAFAGDGTGLLAFAEADDDRLRSATWSPILGWTAAVSGPDLESDVRTVQLRGDPRARLVHAACSVAPNTGGVELRALQWFGTWNEAKPLAADLPDAAVEGFMLDTQGVACEAITVLPIEP